jgi:DNA polymerase II large subunit
VEYNSKVMCSKQIKDYFEALEKMADRCYDISERARIQGKDPEIKVEIPKAEDLAQRVEKLLDFEGIAERIRALTAKYDREEASLRIAKEIAKSDKLGREKALENAIRVGLAVLTEGILVAPLEGVADVKIHGKGPNSYVDVYYAGPIRSAGGTGQAMSVLIADVVRRELGIGIYRPTRKEIERYKEEMALYKTSQYTPSNREIELIVKNCPICIDGEGTEDDEVSGNRDLKRVVTNRVRGGACLVIAEGLCLKASKIQKLVKKLKIDGWEFIHELLGVRIKEAESQEKAEVKVEANYKFIKDIVAGRPVLCHPSRIGGFRLRYGRSRAGGLAAISIHPAVMSILDDFISVGTQIKIERPGKAGAVTPCDSVAGPIVLLDNDDLIEINDVPTALKLRGKVKKIIDLGEVLIPYGEFIENNHVLVPGAYSREWWNAELEKKGGKIEEVSPQMNPEEAFKISEKYSIPLHPDFNLLWHDISAEDVFYLRDFVLRDGKYEKGNLILPNDKHAKEVMITLGASHTHKEEELILEHYAYPVLRCLGLKAKGDSLKERVDASKLRENENNAISLVSHLSGVTIREKGPTRIGARMARPEKAKERKMRPPPHVLFPLGESGGAQRLVSEALKKREIKVEMGIRRCVKCRKRNFSSLCECGGHTVIVDSPSLQKIDFEREYRRAISNLGDGNNVEIKGVRGMISKHKTPEPIEKGILRAKHEVFVFKDGTIRFDMTDVPLTHFRLSEIGLGVEKAKELGYTKDYKGEPLENEEQLIELKPQDIIPSIKCGKYLVKVSKFIDDMLVKFYSLDSFYNAFVPEDLIGHLVVGLAPHTSGGVLARIIGYTKAQVGYAHPFFHAAKRRNCDGDEDCVMLLLDGLINFSRSYLPESRGGLMDAPLVLTTRINPDEIDKEAHNLDVLFRYPLEFYEATQRYSNPKEVEAIMDLVGSRIGEVNQYEGFGFTHDTRNIGEGPEQSAYKTLKSMTDKMEGQLSLAAKIRAVDTDDVVARVINNHFLPDMIGNLRKFSTQQVRCTKCNRKYRRIPLSGKCSGCDGNLTLTVHEGSVKKYLEVSKEIMETYDISNYTRQRIRLMDGAIKSLFQNEKVKECTLEDFL